MATGLPGAKVADHTTDRLGCHGIKLTTATVHADGTLAQTEVIFDAATAQLLSIDTIVPTTGCQRGCPGPGSADLTSQTVRDFTMFVAAGPVAWPRATP